MDEPNWISSDERCHSIFDRISTLLQSSEDDAAPQIRSCTTAIRDMLQQIHSPDGYSRARHMLWAIVLTIAKQLGDQDVRRAFLVDLTLATRHIEGWRSLSGTGSDFSVIHGLFVISNRFEIDAPLHPPVSERKDDKFHVWQAREDPWRCQPGQWLSGQEWTNINAFLAQVYCRAPDLANFDLRGLWTMVEALESSLTATELEDVLPSAAMWIIYAGDALKHSTTPYPRYTFDDPTKRLPWSRGELWTGQSAFSQARWQFWIARLAGIAERTDVSERVRQMASRAVHVNGQQ